MIRRPPRSTLFPSTPLFRSVFATADGALLAQTSGDALVRGDDRGATFRPIPLPPRSPSGGPRRSEEHTSELQSRQYLVCRLLLEKKENQMFSNGYVMSSTMQ